LTFNSTLRNLRRCLVPHPPLVTHPLFPGGPRKTNSKRISSRRRGTAWPSSTCCSRRRTGRRGRGPPPYDTERTSCVSLTAPAMCHSHYQLCVTHCASCVSLASPTVTARMCSVTVELERLVVSVTRYLKDVGIKAKELASWALQDGHQRAYRAAVQAPRAAQAGHRGHGRAVQVDLIIPTLKAPGSKRLKVQM